MSPIKNGSRKGDKIRKTKVKDRQVTDGMPRQSQIPIVSCFYIFGEVLDLSLIMSLSFFRINKPSLLVAAIDFGTTFSGYAFSFLHEYNKDPLKISAATWIAGEGGFVSLKTSTCVLFDPTKTFHSFGYEAEEKYLDLADEDKHHDWFYFRRFKMMLYSMKVLMYT